MPNIQLQCPHCQEQLEAPEELAGQIVPCPHCNQDMALPGTPNPDALMPAEEEDVQQEGLITFPCKYCQTELELSPDVIGDIIPCPSCGRGLQINLSVGTAPITVPGELASPPPSSEPEPADIDTTPRRRGKKIILTKRSGSRRVLPRATRRPSTGAPQADAAATAPGQAPLPPEATGWSWAAFLWGGIWAIGNSVWFGLLDFIVPIPFLMRILLGVMGKRKAWEKGNWRDPDHFVTIQKRWVIVWLIILPIHLAILGASVANLMPAAASARRAALEQAGRNNAQGPNAATPARRPRSVIIQATGRPLAVKAPGGWTRMSSLSSNAILQAGSESAQAYITIEEKPKESALVMGDVFGKAQMEAALTSLSNSVITAELKLIPRIATYPSYQGIVSGARNGKLEQRLLTIIESPSKFYVVTGWTTHPSESELNIRNLKKITESLRRASAYKKPESDSSS